MSEKESQLPGSFSVAMENTRLDLGFLVLNSPETLCSVGLMLGLGPFDLSPGCI